MIEIKYKINELFTKSIGSLSDYVVRVNFEVIGTLDGDSISVKHSTEFVIDESNANFIPYNELTESVVIDWIKQSIGRRANALESIIKKQFEIKSNPPQAPVNTPLPWDSTNQ